MHRTISSPTLLVFEEKHGEDTYLIESLEEFYRIAVAKIRERHEYGYFGIDTPAQIERERDQRIERVIEAAGVAKEYAPRTEDAVRELKELTEEARAAKLFGVTPEVFSAFPQPIREQSLENISKLLSGVSRAFTNSQEELESARNIELIVETERAEELNITYREVSINLAEWILDGRRDGQYEGYELTTPRRAPSAEELEANRKK